jgi:15-cis-phytoene synthase
MNAPARTTAAAANGQALDRSREYCERLTKTFARNFYYGLRLLPAQKRASMYALYAWMRLVDDIADEEDGRPVEERADQLEAWRADTREVLEQGPEAARHYTVRPDARGLWPAFHEMVTRHRVPALVFDEVIAGQHHDLRADPIDTFEQLYDYCYKVAGVVGLASIYVWGFEGGDDTERLAIDRGVAFQLTNIVRDIREDMNRRRSYLPTQEVGRYCPIDDVLSCRDHPEQLRELLEFQIRRAEDYYQRSAGLEERIMADSRPTLIAMTEIYHSILKKMAKRPLRVLNERVSLSLWCKLRIGWRALRAR